VVGRAVFAVAVLQAAVYLNMVAFVTLDDSAIPVLDWICATGATRRENKKIQRFELTIPRKAYATKVLIITRSHGDTSDGSQIQRGAILQHRGEDPGNPAETACVPGGFS
jgi:hypothetical protein